ncbi:MAG: hypothetical protein R3B90_13000 [Planctomycetaceae bacterium]
MADIHDQLHDFAAQRILLLDGAMGSLIHGFAPTEADYRGERFRENTCRPLISLLEVKMLTKLILRNFKRFDAAEIELDRR